MGQELLWGRLGSDLWGRSCCGSDLWGRNRCGPDVGQIYGAGAAVLQMWVRSMVQELLWGDVGLIYGAGAAVRLMGVRSMGRSCCGADVPDKASPLISRVMFSSD